MPPPKLAGVAKQALADEKWKATITQAQAAAKQEKGGGIKDPKKPEKLIKMEVVSGSAWDTFCLPPSTSFKVRIKFFPGIFSCGDDLML